MSESSREWVRRSYSPVMAVIGPVVLWRQLHKADRPLAKAVKIAVMGTAASLLTTVRVVASDDGLTLGFGPFGWPRRVVPMSRIRMARVEAHSALEYVGVAYRWTPTGPRIVLGVGQALVVELENGRTFGVTVPDAEGGANFLNGVIASSTTSTPT